MRDVFKVQRPLAGDMNSVLVYNRTQSIVGHITVSPETMNQLFPNQELRSYWAGHTEGETVVLDAPVSDQGF